MPDLQRRLPSMMVVNIKKNKKKMVSPDGSGSGSTSSYIFSSRIYTDIPLYESPGVIKSLSPTNSLLIEFSFRNLY